MYWQVWKPAGVYFHESQRVVVKKKKDYYFLRVEGCYHHVPPKTPPMVAWGNILTSQVSNLQASEGIPREEGIHHHITGELEYTS